MDEVNALGLSIVHRPTSVVYNLAAAIQLCKMCPGPNRHYRNLCWYYAIGSIKVHKILLQYATWIQNIAAHFYHNVFDGSYNAIT